MSADLDYDWLAQQFQITGGNIKNIVLNAAFFAAADGGVIGMEHILRGAEASSRRSANCGTTRTLSSPNARMLYGYDKSRNNTRPTEQPDSDPSRRLRVRRMGQDSLSMFPSRVRRCIGTSATVTCRL